MGAGTSLLAILFSTGHGDLWWLIGIETLLYYEGLDTECARSRGAAGQSSLCRVHSTSRTSP